jgi:glycosyltransferase involved in cell wall biosynthesis
VQALDAVCWTDYVVVDLETHTLLQNDGTKLPPGIMLEVEVNILHTNADTAMENAQALRRLGVRSQRSIGFWAWELEWLPNYWRHAYSFYDEIWASTRFAEAAFNRDALRPVRHVPMVVAEPATEARMSRSDLDLPDDATLFVFMFDFRSYAARKNPEAVVRAFLAAFPDLSEPAYLLIKTSGAAAMPADAARLRDLARDRRIEIRDAILDRPQLLELVRSADAFVSLHRSEGFGRGPAEAMLLGTPAIVTNYSGSTDYATDECALLVDFDLIPVAETDYPGVTGQRWAEARIPTAARHMRWVHEHQADARALGRQGQSRIRGLYGPRSVGDAMIRAMGLSAPSKGQPNGLEALGIEPL